MLTVAVPKRNKLPNIIVLTPKDGVKRYSYTFTSCRKYKDRLDILILNAIMEMIE